MRRYWTVKARVSVLLKVGGRISVSERGFRWKLLYTFFPVLGSFSGDKAKKSRVDERPVVTMSKGESDHLNRRTVLKGVGLGAAAGLTIQPAQASLDADNTDRQTGVTITDIWTGKGYTGATMLDSEKRQSSFNDEFGNKFDVVCTVTGMATRGGTHSLAVHTALTDGDTIIGHRHYKAEESYDPVQISWYFDADKSPGSYEAVTSVTDMYATDCDVARTRFSIR